MRQQRSGGRKLDVNTAEFKISPQKDLLWKFYEEGNEFNEFVVLHGYTQRVNTEYKHS